MSSSTLSSSPDVFFSKHADVSDPTSTSRTYDQRRRMVREIVQKELATRKNVSEVDLLDFGCGAGVLLADLVKLGSALPEWTPPRP